MTTIPLLGGDFEILFEDETVGTNAVAGLQLVRRASGASATVYTTRQLYSAIADVTDDFVAMGFENPMLPVTPNAFTMENNYFIPRSSTEFLKEGAITGSWAVSNGKGVYSKVYSGGTNFVTGDIGRQVIEGTSGDAGTLLDFEVLPDGTLLAWIRPDTSTDTFQLTTGISVTADGGTGTSAGSEPATSGTSLYSSIQAIGSVPTATEVYLYQERQKMTDSTGAFQWWATDPGVSLGIIDILIRVQRDSAFIADGDVEIFARRYTSLYDNFRLNVAAGGRSALPLASAPDINNTTGYRQASWTSGTGTPMQIGDILTNTSVAGGFVVVTSVSETGSPVGVTGTFDYYLVGELIDFSDTNTFTSSNRNGTISGAPIANLGGPTDTASGEGGTVTIAFGTTTFDFDGDATAEPYSITIDAKSNVPIAKVYERIKYVTRRGADASVLFGAGVNVPGESYRGLESQAFYDNPIGTFTQGDDVRVAPGSPEVVGFTARVISVNTTDAYVMLTDRQTSLTPLANNDVLKDESNDTVDILGAPITFTSPKASPFGTFTGSQIFGARGVLFINPAPGNTQSYILTDDNGVLRNPPNNVSFVVNNTVSGDRILVARDTGVAGVINKDQFGGIETPSGSPLVFNTIGNQTIRVAGSIDSEVAQVGFVRIVENTKQEEHRYEYSSRTTGALGEFTLTNIASGTADAGSSATQLVDNRDFVADGVKVGMLVRNTFAGKTTHVHEVTGFATLGSPASNNVLLTTPLYGPLDATQDWDTGDTYEINRLIQTYAATDDLYDLIIDEEATTTTSSNTFVKTLASDFDVVVNARQGKVILPFTQNTTVGDGGGSSTVVRTPDTIAL